MKCNNRCYRLLTISRNRIHSHVDRRTCIQFPYIMRFLIQSMNVGLIFFFFSSFFFTLDKWHLSPFYHQQLSRNPQILQVRHEFDKWDYPTLYQSSADLVLCGRISKHCAKSRPWQGEMGSVTAKCSKEAAFGAGIGLLVLIAVWCWYNRFLLGGGGLRSFELLQDFINVFLFSFFLFFFWLWQF